MAMISVQNLTLLPDVARLRALLQSMAMLDAILSPEWESRYYSFNRRWSSSGEMGSMRDGCGDDFFALFNAAGCFLKGFAHEASMSPYRHKPKRIWPGVLDGIPAEFEECLQEPAFCIEDTTFCIWRCHSDGAWQRGAIDFPVGGDPDGSKSLLSVLDGKPESYKAWSEDYYEVSVPLASVRHVYAHKPLTAKLVQRLNSELEFEELAADIDEIGYCCEASAEQEAE